MHPTVMQQHVAKILFRVTVFGSVEEVRLLYTSVVNMLSLPTRQMRQIGQWPLNSDALFTPPAVFNVQGGGGLCSQISIKKYATIHRVVLELF